MNPFYYRAMVSKLSTITESFCEVETLFYCCFLELPFKM